LGNKVRQKGKFEKKFEDDLWKESAKRLPRDYCITRIGMMEKNAGGKKKISCLIHAGTKLRIRHREPGSKEKRGKGEGEEGEPRQVETANQFTKESDSQKKTSKKSRRRKLSVQKSGVAERQAKGMDAFNGDFSEQKQKRIWMPGNVDQSGAKGGRGRYRAGGGTISKNDNSTAKPRFVQR